MKFLLESSPHDRNESSQTSVIMLMIIVGLIPAVIMHIYCFGLGLLWHLLLSCPLAALVESVCLKLRGYSAVKGMKDFSIQVTAVIYCLAIPPYLSLGLTAAGIIFATVIVKQCFGGLGQNTFNPAMAAYIFLLVSAPNAMNNWNTVDSHTKYSLADSYYLVTGQEDRINNFDAATAATPLGEFKIDKSSNVLSRNHINSDPLPEIRNFIQQNPMVAMNIAYLFGGILLMLFGYVSTSQPVTFLLVAFGFALLYGYLGKVYEFPAIAPIEHLLIGATMMGAFFIITDPVSSPTTVAGRIVSAALIAFFVITIRTFGNYPDAVAFGALLGNSFNPLINKLIVPARFGSKEKI